MDFWERYDELQEREERRGAFLDWIHEEADEPRIASLNFDREEW